MAHALALACRAGDEEVRHPREVGDDRRARYVVAEAEGEHPRTLPERGRLQDLSDGDQAGGLVGHLDADRSLAGNRCLDPERGGGKRER